MRRNYERYRQIFERYRHKTNSTIDSISEYVTRYNKLRDSEIHNCLWTANEKERFFTALARCGKGNLAEVARRVGTKSLAQITAYVGMLDEAVAWRKQSSTRHAFFDHSKLPGAVEVDDEWLAFEELAAKACIKQKEEAIFQDAEEDTFILNIQKANELAQWYRVFKFSDVGIKKCSPIGA